MVEKTGEDLTARMRRWASRRIAELGALGLHGYVLKRGSPSCGLIRVRVYGEDGTPGRVGRGLFAAALIDALPLLPVEEEGRLTDAGIRESFIERVFAAARWQAFAASRPRAARSRGVPRRAQVRDPRPQPAGVHASSAASWPAPAPASAAETLATYGTRFMHRRSPSAPRAPGTSTCCSTWPASSSAQLGDDERAELGEVIAEYRRGLVPLVVPLTLLKHHVRRLGLAYLADQVYLDPHPKELMLRNHV